MQIKALTQKWKAQQLNSLLYPPLEVTKLYRKYLL
jgi:hypothetical protein